MAIVILFVYFVLIRGNVFTNTVGGTRRAFMGASGKRTYTPEEVAKMQGRLNELEGMLLSLSEENFLLRSKLDLDDSAKRYGLPYYLADAIKAKSEEIELTQKTPLISHTVEERALSCYSELEE